MQPPPVFSSHWLLFFTLPILSLYMYLNKHSAPENTWDTGLCLVYYIWHDLSHLIPCPPTSHSLLSGGPGVAFYIGSFQAPGRGGNSVWTLPVFLDLEFSPKDLVFAWVYLLQWFCQVWFISLCMVGGGPPLPAQGSCLVLVMSQSSKSPQN